MESPLLILIAVAPIMIAMGFFVFRQLQRTSNIEHDSSASSLDPEELQRVEYSRRVITESLEKKRADEEEKRKQKEGADEMLRMQHQTLGVQGKWIYIWDSLSSDSFTIGGLPFEWGKNWNRVSGEQARVIDPIYGAVHSYPISERKNENGESIRIAWTEQTPGVYLAYTDNQKWADLVDPKPTREIKFK